MRKIKFISGIHRGSAFLLFGVLALICILSVQVRADDSTQVVVRNTIYHTHTGSSGSGGGCYSISRSGSRTIEVPCGGTLYYWGSDWDKSECTVCGAGYYGNRGGESCPHSTTRTETYTYYELGCGKSPSTVVGYVTYTKNTAEWATEVIVKVDIENLGMSVGDSPYRINGTPSSDGTFVLTDNGTYTFGVVTDPNAATGATNYTVTITNIDRTSPVINDYSLTPSDWVKEGVTLSLNDVKDLQPDNSDGCGLDELPYSYDGGNTWTDDPTHFYEDNGDYTVLVRDKLLNTTTLNFTIDNIDHEPPRILKFEYDDTKNIPSTTLFVECDDVLSDGREGCGLNEPPFSYDGGKTWTDATSLYIGHNTTIEFVVRDKLGNENRRTIVITNIDDYEPTVSHSLYPGYWTNGDVEISFNAYDRNPDGSDGVGLPSDCFSYDSGRTWTSENSVTVSDNQNVHVAVRDKNGNTNYYSLDIINIDRVAPTISAAYTITEDKLNAILTASGNDGESGIAGYTWDGPESGAGETFIVKTNGVYTVTARDKAGNTASATVNVIGIREGLLRDIIDVINGDDDDDSGNLGLKNETGITNMLPERNNEMVIKMITQDDANANMESNVPDRSFFERIRDRIKQWWENLSDFAKFMIAVLALILLGLFILLLWLLTRLARIYADKEDDNFILIAINRIKHEDGRYVIDIPQEIIDKATTTHLRIKLGIVFSFIHKDTEICIHTPGRTVVTEVCKCMDILI